MIATLFLILGEIGRRIWRGLTFIAELLHESAIARYIAVGLLGAMLVLIVVFSRSCRDTDPLRPVIIEGEQNVNHAVDAVNRANANVKNAEDRVNKAQENLNRVRPEKNVSLDEANRNRCLAYEDDPRCK